MTGEEIYNKFYKNGTDERSKEFQRLHYHSELNVELAKFYKLIKKAHINNLKFVYAKHTIEFLRNGGCFEENLGWHELAPVDTPEPKIS